MDVMIYTSDPDAVDPEAVAQLLSNGGFFVASVVVNDGERRWEM
jgi:hypothetical protein